MKRLLHANAWIATVLGIILTIGYYMLFFKQLFGSWEHQLLLVFLILVQIWTSVALVWVLSEIAYRTRFFFIHTAVKLITFGIILFMAGDAVSLFTANMKISLIEFVRFASGGFERDAIIPYSVLVTSIIAVVLVLLTTYVLFAFKKITRISEIFISVMGAWIVCGLTTFSFLQQASGPYLGILLINPLIYNIQESIFPRIFQRREDNKIFPNQSQPVEDDYAKYFHTLTGNAQHKNIIVVFAESFDPKYSATTPGLRDRLPQYDAIAAQGIRYDNFLAPGCVSEHAHISFLQGLFPIAYGDTFVSAGYQQFKNPVDSLPLFFSKQGYHTTFISTARLSFLGQNKYLQDQGFSSLIDESSFGGKKYTFNAAPDEELYKKALSEIKAELSSSQPFYINLQTISTHTPRSSPYGNKERDVRRYADDQIAKFYKELRQTNFFDNGVLVVFGDHRVPGDSSQKEQTAIGPLWPSKVLATVIDGHTSGIENMITQPIDLHFSLKKLIGSGQVLTRDFYNDVFDHVKRRDWGLNYCKYRSQQINFLQTGSFQSLEDVPIHDAYKFVKSFQRYQLKKNIIETTISSGSQYSGLKALENFTLIGHAGALNYAPSDSMTGFMLALAQGANALQLDLSFTMDNVNVVRSGPYPTPSCNKRKKIKNRNYDAMRKECKLNNGEAILRFDEFVSITKDIVPLYVVELNVEDQSKGIVQMYDAIATVKKYGVEKKVIFISRDPLVRKALLKNQDIRVARDMYDQIGQYPSSGEMNRIEYLMTTLDALNNTGHVATLVSLQKPILLYVTQIKKDITDAFFMRDYLKFPLSGMLLDDIPLFLQTLQN